MNIHDLNRDKIVGEDFRNVWVFKGLSLHDVAPVTGGVPHRQKDGLVLLPGFLKCLFPPWIPSTAIIVSWKTCLVTFPLQSSNGKC